MSWASNFGVLFYVGTRACLFLVSICLVPLVQASTFKVTTAADSGHGSLRQAILDSNERGGGSIVFSNVTSPIRLLSALPTIETALSITGPGTNLLTVSGGSLFRIFSVAAGSTSTVSGLTIADGMITNNSYESGDYPGGAGVSNAGSLKLLSCIISNCVNNKSFGDGGGIYNAGDLYMEACLVADCHVDPLYGLAIQEDSQITGESSIRR